MKVPVIPVLFNVYNSKIQMNCQALYGKIKLAGRETANHHYARRFGYDRKTGYSDQQNIIFAGT